MKKFVKYGIMAIIAIVFIGTFVFLYQKSLPKVTKYEILTPERTNLEKTTNTLVFVH